MSKQFQKLQQEISTKLENSIFEENNELENTQNRMDLLQLERYMNNHPFLIKIASIVVTKKSSSLLVISLEVHTLSVCYL